MNWLSEVGRLQPPQNKRWGVGRFEASGIASELFECMWTLVYHSQSCACSYFQHPSFQMTTHSCWLSINPHQHGGGISGAVPRSYHS